MNATLQGAYLMPAARALGLDAGPMAGFNRTLVDAAFLEGTTFATLSLCNLGYRRTAGPPTRPALEVRGDGVDRLSCRMQGRTREAGKSRRSVGL